LTLYRAIGCSSSACSRWGTNSPGFERESSPSEVIPPTVALVKEELDQRGRGRYAFADAAKAHADLEGRGTIGKMLIIPHEG